MINQNSKSNHFGKPKGSNRPDYFYLQTLPDMRHLGNITVEEGKTNVTHVIRIDGWMDGHDSPFENGQKNMLDGGRPTGNNCRGINYPFNFRTKSSHPTGKGHVVLLSGGRKCREKDVKIKRGSRNQEK